MSGQIKPIIYFRPVFYVLLAATSFAFLLIFRPFIYTDNNKSKIICANNNTPYDIGPNYIFVYDHQLDSFNDIKARKLCEYSSIRDYGNYYQTPASINYKFVPEIIKESSWGDAALMSLAVFFIGAYFFEIIFKWLYPKNQLNYNPKKLILTLVIGLILSIVLFKRPATAAFCKKQIATKIVNARNSAFKYGVITVPEEDRHLQSILKPLYEKCLLGN